MKETGVRYSIVLPTLNEAKQVKHLLTDLTQLEESYECIVVDGGSKDSTIDLLKAYSNVHLLKSDAAQRAAQLNLGAKKAKGQYLIFLHADSRLPNNFEKRLKQAHSSNVKLACFRLRFDHEHWFLKFNAWFTRFNSTFFRYGDQSLFASRDVFFLAGGYDESLDLLEDQEIIWRLKRFTRMRIWPESITTSARKYLHYGMYRLQLLYAKITIGYYLGFSQERLCKYYQKTSKAPTGPLRT
jgi:rSAM/selenodomain-associated transferase 2